MKIVDLSETHQKLYFVCLEDWSDEMKDAGVHKETWFHKMKDKGRGDFQKKGMGRALLEAAEDVAPGHWAPKAWPHGVFHCLIDGKRVGAGPPMSYEKIRSMIEKKVKKVSVSM